MSAATQSRVQIPPLLLGLAVKRPRAGRVPGRAALEAVFVLALAVLAVWARQPPLGAHMWIDEGLSVGIASHPLGEIAHLLRLDGSPPLYYVLLHVWMSQFGASEAATHGLSLTCAVLAVPAGWWAARPFGAAAGVLCAALVALNPFVGLYAVETRMYALVLLLALLATGAFIRAFVDGRRPYAVLLAVLLAAVLYTHAWGGFLAIAMGLTWLGLLAFGPNRRRLAVDGVLAFGGAFVLFAPWLPTLAFQAAHTGAPWSHRPTGRSLERAISRMLGGRQAETLLLVVGLGLVVEGFRTGTRRERLGGVSILLVAALTLLVAWWWSRVQEPAWALRYLVIVLAPLSVVLAAGLGRAPALGVVLVATLFFLSWHGHPPPGLLRHKSNVAAVAQRLERRLPPGTMVLSVQPEQTAALAYYLPHRLRWMTPMGRVRDPRVMDWRDAMTRLRRARYDHVVPPVTRRLHPGGRLLLIAPHFKRVDSPWTARLKRMARSWTGHLRHSRYLRVVKTIKPHRSSTRSSVTAVLFERRRHVVVHRLGP